MRGSSMVTLVPEIVSVPAPFGSLATSRSGLNQVAAAKPTTSSTTRAGIAIRNTRTRRLWRLATRKARERSERRVAVQPSLRSIAVALVRRLAPSFSEPRNQARDHTIFGLAAQNGRGMWPRHGTPRPGAASSGARKNVSRRPPGEIEPRPVGQEAKTSLGKLGAALAREHRVELVFERMQMQHVGGRIGNL